MVQFSKNCLNVMWLHGLLVAETKFSKTANENLHIFLQCHRLFNTSKFLTTMSSLTISYLMFLLHQFVSSTLPKNQFRTASVLQPAAWTHCCWWDVKSSSQAAYQIPSTAWVRMLHLLVIWANLWSESTVSYKVIAAELIVLQRSVWHCFHVMVWKQKGA